MKWIYVGKVDYHLPNDLCIEPGQVISQTYKIPKHLRRKATLGEIADDEFIKAFSLYTVLSFKRAKAIAAGLHP